LYNKDINTTKDKQLLVKIIEILPNYN